jgi:hypothetical protein
MADYESSETGNWNVAENWSNSLIFKPFFECSEYLTLAQFGCSDISEDFMFDEKTKIKTRIESLKWAKHKLEMGIRQCMFAVRNANDKTKMNNYLKEVIDLKEPIKNIEEIIMDRDLKKSIINEEYFDLVFNVLLRIFTEITEPMNRSDLIFNFKETFDPSEYKRNIKNRFVQGL